MKLTVVLLTAAFLHVQATGLSQAVTFSGKNVSLEKVFKAVKKQTGYVFFYNAELLEKARPVDIEAKNVPLEQFLNELFADQPLEYEIRSKSISLSRKVVEEDRTRATTSGPVKGRVVNEKGEPVEGVSVTVKGSNIGTSTNANGEFYLDDIDDNATLIFTHTSIEKIEQKRNGRAELTIGVKIKSSILDEVQVIPYGTQTKRFAVGNVTTVKGEDIAKQPVNNPLLALAGRVPGLFVTQQTGVPGGDVTVRVQGQNSIGKGNEPLYVIDGVPFPAQFPMISFSGVLGATGGSPLSLINPADIESIEVLKDADATAIYGSRAANGAILITTKKGTSGRLKFDIDIKQGWSDVAHEVSMLDTRRYLDMRYEAYRNDSIDWMDPNVSANDLKFWDTTRYTNWQKELIGGSAQFSTINIGLSGGSENSQYTIGSTYHRETTVFPGNFKDSRASVHFTVNNMSTNQKLKTQFSGSYMTNRNRLPASDLMPVTIRMEPNAPPLYTSDQSLNWALDSTGTSTWSNPIAEYTLQKSKSDINNLIANFLVSYNIGHGLEIRTSGGYTNRQRKTVLTFPLSMFRPEDRPYTPRAASYGNDNFESWILEPQIHYNSHLGKGDLHALLGSTIQQTENTISIIEASGHSSDLLLEDIESAISLTTNSSVVPYKYNALFARLTYNWRDKYIINAAARRDGSSRFGSNNRFHNFTSLGLAWIFSEENAVKNNFSALSFGKLRGSYGTTGNDQIRDYGYLGVYYPSSSDIAYQNSPGLYTASLPNPYLQWEETRKWQFGVDLGFWNDRIVFNGTYARNRSSNQLIGYALPSFVGVDNIQQNFPATVQNESWELQINATVIKSKLFEWRGNVNVTVPKNKLVNFPGLETSTYNENLVVGEPLNITKVPHFLGVDPTTGLYQIADSHGNPTSTPNPEDFNILINTLPKIYGGMQHSMVYKGIGLSFLFQFVEQQGVQNLYYSAGRHTPGRFRSGSSNQPVTVLDRWQKPGDNRPVQRFSATLPSPSKATGSDAGFTDATFARLKSMSVSYKMPTKWVSKILVQNGTVYIEAQNLLTITKYKGLDPETQNIEALPPLRTVVIGVKLGL